MGLHLVALAKFHLFSSSRSSTPLVAGLICPFVLKVSFRSKIVRRVYSDVIDASRLFFFQLSQIAFEADHDLPAPGNGDRWQRALRLVCQRIAHVRRSPAVHSDNEDNFHTLTMLSL